MSGNLTTIPTGNTNGTMLSNVVEFKLPVVRQYAQWIQVGILVLGLITNPMIIYVLSKKCIGSDTTRILLIFLALSDVGCLVTNFLVSIVSSSEPLWFEIFSTDLSCGLSDVFQQMILTSSSWYIVLLTIERTTVVYFPLKAKILYTRKRTLVACFLVPIVWVIIYSWTGHIVESYHVPEWKRIRCKGKDEYQELYDHSYTMWVCLYLFAPAGILVLLNIAIVIRLRKVRKLHKILTRSQPLSYRVTKFPEEETSYSTSSTIRESSDHTDNSSSDYTEKSQAALNLASDKYVENKFSIRKATRLVLAASIVFIVCMIPRGISYVLMATYNPEKGVEHTDKIHIIVDAIAWLLQYLNHAINLFIYVLANKNFRFTS